MKSHLSNAVLVLFSGVLAAMLVYLFYASALRDRVENKLYDIRTRLAPDLVSTDAVAVVGISQKTIDTLEIKTAADKEAKPADLSYDQLIRIVKAVLSTKARTVAVLLPPQVFPYEDSKLAQLTALARADKRLLFGTFDLSTKDAGQASMPSAFNDVRSQVAKADVTRDFRRDIIRKMTIAEKGELPYLAAHLLAGRDPGALSAFPRGSDDSVQVELNYVRPQHFATVPAEEVLAEPSAMHFDRKIVLVGYTAYRPWTFREREATFVNTPWQAEGDEVKEGVPLVMIQAIGILNLLEKHWLSPVPLTVTVVQAIVIAVLALAAWQFSAGFASLLFIGGWSMILIFHALIFSLAKVHIPLADAFLWSSLATTAGASLKLREEGRLRALQEARFRAEKNLSETQDLFLSRFAAELASLNTRVTTLLKSLSSLMPAAGTAQTAYVRALGSSEDLGEYLAGILQFVSLREHELVRPPLVPVDVGQTIDAVVKQFDSRRQDMPARFQLSLLDECMALADRTLVGQILYNLISNAVKYSPPGGVVAISIEKRANHVFVLVKDQGPGIAPEFHERIFEKFYRVKDDFVYKTKGHGLGLYLSRFFATQIGGTIGMSSEPGRGAEFSLTLRAARR